MKRLSLMLLTLAVAGCGGSNDNNGSAANSGSFAQSVAPIFAAKCAPCHFDGSPSLLQLTDPFNTTTGLVNRTGTWTTAKNTILVVPGKPEESFLIDKVKRTDLSAASEGAAMPLNMDPISNDQIATIRTWIENGAANDSDFTDNVVPIFGKGTLGAPGLCSYCHQPGSTNRPDLVHPFDPSTGVVNVEGLLGVEVVPGNADGSVLFKKISVKPLPASLGSSMPYAIPRLTTAEVTALETWITNGAKND